MILDRLFETRASLENPSTTLSEALGAIPTTSNVVVNERRALQVVAFWSAVNTISDTLAVLPIKLIRKNNNNEHQVVTDHPVWARLDVAPNRYMDSIVFRSTLQSHVLTWGNGYAWLRRNAIGEVQAMLPLDPGTTKPVVKNKKLYYETQSEDVPKLLKARNVLHIPALSRDGLEGMSVIREQREMIGSALAAQEYGGRLFANGAKPGGILSFPGKVRDPDKLKSDIRAAYTGENQHSLMVLGGDAKYSSFSIPPDDAQFLQTREFSIDEIGRMFRLPLHFLNKMGQATFNNLEMMGTHFVQYTMMPWFQRWEQQLSRKLLTEEEIAAGYRFKVNVNALVRGDIATRSNLYTAAITSGWMTRNEVRALEDMNPLDGLDDPLVPLNLGVIGDDTDDEATGDGTPEDEGGTNDTDPDSDPAADSNERASFVVVQACAERLVQNECNAVQRAVKHDDRVLRIDRFYDKHEQLLVDNLAIPVELARQYCARHREQLANGQVLTELYLEWQTAGVVELINMSEALK